MGAKVPAPKATCSKQDRGAWSPYPLQITRHTTWTWEAQGEVGAERLAELECTRKGLRTDHTYRHHGERSQGYQCDDEHLIGVDSDHCSFSFQFRTKTRTTKPR